MPEIATTKEQRDLMAHAINAEDRIRDWPRRHRRPYKDREYRNYFCAEVGSPDDQLVTALCEMGLMRKGHKINDGRDYYAYVTVAGVKEVMP